MAQTTTAASPPRRPVSYRALGAFWAVVIGLGAAGGVTLQVMGPVGPAAPAGPRSVRQPPSSSGPKVAPDVAKTEAAIPAPSPDLLDPPLSPTDFPEPELAGARLPRIAAGGRTWPAKYYAAPFDLTDRHPHVVLVVSGAGLDQNLTLKLLHDLPGAIDVVFSAYTPPDRAASLAEAARDTGHECLLSIPMEPSTAPIHDEGPHQLLADMTDDEYTQNMYWSLSRLGGCIGATGAADNGMRGDRFAQTPQFTNLLVDVTKRGLMYLDPHTGTTVLYPAEIKSPELPTPGNIDLVRKTEIVVDEQVQYDEPLSDDQIRHNLDTLAGLASPDQPPIGLAVNLTPNLVSIIHDWANTLPAKGVTIMPLSATPKMPPPPPPDVIPDPNAPPK
jgi:polysaccharide deacetylase 2 family uncharacterized protein YibQ